MVAPPPAGRRISEDVLQPAPLLLDPDERQTQIRDRVADHVVHAVVVERDEHASCRPPGAGALARQCRRQLFGALLDLDREHGRALW